MSDTTGGSGDGEPERSEEEHRPGPAPGRSPEDVVRTVLSALRDADGEDGIHTAYAFASPAYRNRVGGSFEAFADHLRGPVHRMLLDHERARRGRLVREGRRATERVVVTDPRGDETTYSFSLRSVDDGDGDERWLVDDVELVYVGASPEHRHMPVVEFDGVAVKCAEGSVLRDVLLGASGVSPHDEAAQYANCNGKGLCGTCAVEVVEGSVSERTAREKRRLRLPPHDETDDPNLRLSCQCEVSSDLVVEKHEGAWDRHVEEYDGDAGDPDGDVIDVSDRETPSLPEDDRDDPGDGDGGGGGTIRSEEADSLLDETDDVIDDG
jgi:ferredoxin